MKISKNLLKNIIKECLVEILTEGMGISTNTLKESISKQHNNNRQQNVQQTTPLKTPELIKSVESGENYHDTLQEILAHTAATTLQQQLQAERQIPSVSTMNVEPTYDVDHTPMTEQAEIWSTLAFAPSKRK